MRVKEHWFNSDFEDMGWHDSRLYSIVIPSEDFKLSLDIDYIFKWAKSDGEQEGFWVSPCELLFFDVAGLKINVDFQDNMLLFISDIRRKNERLSPNGKAVEWDFEIECDLGLVSFSATGFEQRVRTQPVLSETQDLNKNR